MANTLDRFKQVKINGKEYKFGYTVRSIIEAEKELDYKSILNTIAAPPLSFADSFTFFKHGMLGGGLKFASEDAVEELLLDYLNEKNLGDLQTLILEALMASGALGKIENKEKNA